MLCRSCGATIAEEANFCSNCGQRVGASGSPVSGGSANASADDATRQSEASSIPSFDETRYRILASVLETTHGTRSFAWQTSSGATVGGVAVFAAFNLLSGRAMPLLYAMDMFAIFLVASVVYVAYSVASLFYAVWIYPTFFSSTPKLTDNVKISFLNGMFGGVIFGCLWNANVTKGKVGNSCVVYAVLEVLGLLDFFVTVSLGLGMYSATLWGVQG